MAAARIKFDNNEIEISEAVTTIGRASDNTVAFSNDSNVSRYHAEIALRDGEFRLNDLRSSNGTTVNGERVTSDVLLKNEDEIIFGGSSVIRFLTIDSAENTVDEKAENPVALNHDAPAKKEAEIAEDANAASKMPVILGCTGAVCGLAFVFVVAAILFSYCAAPQSCEATAKIVKPDDGETLYEPAEIELAAENADCVARAVFLINGVEFAAATEQPYTAILDPNKFPDLADGSLQSVQIVLEDKEGNKIMQPGAIALNLQTAEIAAPTPIEVAENPTPKPTAEKDAKISLGETRELSKKFIEQFSGGAKYNFSNPQFLQEVRKKTAAFTNENYFGAARKYRDAINVAFVQEENLDAPLGFVLALSRSGFKPEKQDANEGLWQMNSEFAATNSYNALCGTQTLADDSQQCAARTAALYLKSLVLTVFEGDVLYSVAAFGMSSQEANIWKSTLPPNRSDFYSVIKNPKQRDEVINFIVAGIVAENPEKFGLKNVQPLSRLYP